MPTGGNRGNGACGEGSRTAAQAQPQSGASSLEGGDDTRRNARYRVTVDCFDRLKGLEFKKLLARYHISLTTDVRSLHPTDEGWNRKFE